MFVCKKKSFVSFLLLFVENYCYICFEESVSMIDKKKKINLSEPSVSDSGVTIAFKNQGIYYVKVHDEEVFSVDFFNLSINFRKEHPQHDPKLLIFEFGKYASVDAETREYSAQRKDSPFLAEAIIVTNLAQRLLAKHYAHMMNNRGVNVQVFNDYNTARSWLLSQTI